MAEKGNDKPKTLFSYRLDPEWESEELDGHRARFAGLTLERYRVMRAYAAFKRQKKADRKNTAPDDEQ